jgi:hypothetical protein
MEITPVFPIAKQKFSRDILKTFGILCCVLKLCIYPMIFRGTPTDVRTLVVKQWFIHWKNKTKHRKLFQNIVFLQRYCRWYHTTTTYDNTRFLNPEAQNLKLLTAGITSDL